MNPVTEREIALLERIRDLEVRLKKAQQQTYEQKKRATHWREKALARGVRG